MDRRRCHVRRAPILRPERGPASTRPAPPCRFARVPHGREMRALAFIGFSRGVGCSTWSITIASTGPLADSSLSPSCSTSAVMSDGRSPFASVLVFGRHSWCSAPSLGVQPTVLGVQAAVLVFRRQYSVFTRQSWCSGDWLACIRSSYGRRRFSAAVHATDLTSPVFSAPVPATVGMYLPLVAVFTVYSDGPRDPLHSIFSSAGCPRDCWRDFAAVYAVHATSHTSFAQNIFCPRSRRPMPNSSSTRSTAPGGSPPHRCDRAAASVHNLRGRPR